MSAVECRPLVQEVTMERAIPTQEADQSVAEPSVRVVPAASVLRWLRLGARDLDEGLLPGVHGLPLECTPGRDPFTERALPRALPAGGEVADDVGEWPSSGCCC